ncbi:Chaperone clpB, putative [Perkinsus marinus ATCC 50983]|uniref:Lon protease homolog n=1 Tax=Perkinsus marinus (strain ATCC 50983 / TXsc) TaxID=423536 RepID=C5LQP8_PERM5|nr:Chaperone clpB, putative [Perkinsus marinus ATCC 50983]EER00783.1 Chaperone clpB, putative [Perkinsus marinus ATCC 50983]|eukprot:XP_002768065.1 Chaperone clpB, putative [Perkinsus marinus ATCC 50983]
MTAPRGKTRAVEREGGGSSGGLRRSEAGSMVFVLPLRNRVLFPGLRAQALALVAHQKTVSLEDSLSHDKLVTVGVRNSDREGSKGDEKLYTVGTLCRMVSSSVAPHTRAGEVDEGDQIVLTLEGLDRVELETSGAALVWDGSTEGGERNVVHGKVWVSRVLGSVQKGPTRELEALADGLQRKVAELFQLEKRLQGLAHGGKAGGLPGPLGGLITSLWNSGREGGKDRETAITEVPMKADKCSLFADIICATLKDVPMVARQQALECLCIEDRLHMATNMVAERREALLVTSRVRGNMRKQADMDVRERVIRRQIEELQKELRKISGGNEAAEDEVTSIVNKLAAIPLPEDMRRVCDREIHKLQSTPTTHPDYTVTRTYLETVASLPWSLECSEAVIDLDRAREVLERDHFGMTKVKKRVREFLAVMKLHQARGGSQGDEEARVAEGEGRDVGLPVINRRGPPGPVVCLVGPPGVGKTSLCRSIAEALGKRFCRVSLGGVRDEAEIRGHRRTYIGAMLGTVLQELARCGSRECVMLLDEIDKVAQPGFNSNAQAALLELLDPSQHATFRDHYLGVPFDLSCVTFICTANSAGEMSRPLIDRLEMVELESYTLEEKREIAKRHLIPRQLEYHCLAPGSAKIEDDAIDYLVECYTKEAGVRSLERRLGDVCRYVAIEMVENKKDSPSPFTIQQRDIPDILGPETFESPARLARRRARQQHSRGQQIGVALGLAVTAGGGDVLEIETTLTSSSASVGAGTGKVSITGQLGKVMQESVSAALAQLKARVYAVQDRAMAEGTPSSMDSIFRLIEPKLLTSADVHVHFPAGAVPKDGPSAGVAVFLALVSLFAAIPVPSSIATTGEITLTGQVLPVGGVRDKVLAAQRAGIDTVIIPRSNAKTLRASLPLSVTDSIELVFIDHVDEALLRVFRPQVQTHSSDNRAPPLRRPSTIATVSRSAL